MPADDDAKYVHGVSYWAHRTAATGQAADAALR
jgi:hypothetical protein